MAAVVVPVAVLPACSEDNPLCCTEFKVGATISADIGGSAESQVAVQAVADFSGIASAALDDITGACRSMAQDLDASKAEQDKAEANTDKQAKLKAWCSLAVASLKGAVSAAGTLKVVAAAPKCEASVSAKANCQAKCSGSAQCDIKANPPQCTGGSLEVACKGECTAKANVALKCEGKCTGSCKGSCQAQGGVDCEGKCEGTCEAKAGVDGSGAQADGTCKGTCKGTCSVTAPNVQCSGSCTGECSASCTGTAEASVKCDGECKADFEPLKCTGGTLEGGCKVEAKCEGNCDASVKAKAECTPPAITIEFTAVANADIAGKLEATLKANLGVVLAFKSRLEGMVSVAGRFSGNIDAVTDIKAACIPMVIASVGNAVSDVQASATATIDIAGAVGAGG